MLVFLKFRTRIQREIYIVECSHYGYQSSAVSTLAIDSER
jgi:hypothetical protein